MEVLINPARVDFVTLQLYCAVAQSGSISQGARARNLALSAASRRLSEFEATLGMRLLERTPHGVSVTPAGAVALQHATRLLQDFSLFGSEIREFSHGIRGHVRLWANMSSLTEFLPELILSFLREFPAIRIEVEEQLSGETARAVADGVADVGIIAEGTPTWGLQTSVLIADELVVACAKGHPLASRKSVAFNECLDYDIVGLNRGSSLLNLIARAADEAGRPLRVRIQVRSFDALCRMISVNLGIGVLPRAAVQDRLAALGMKAIRLTDPWARRKLLVATKANVEPTPAVASFLQHLRILAGSPSAK